MHRLRQTFHYKSIGEKKEDANEWRPTYFIHINFHLLNDVSKKHTFSLWKFNEMQELRKIVKNRSKLKTVNQMPKYWIYN